MNIYEKWNWIMEQVQYLAKDGKIDYGQTHYKAMTEEKVTSTIRPFLVQQKLIMIPVEQISRKEGNLTTVDVAYKVINAEAPEESFTIVSSGQGADTQDKGIGKAMTYAFKYALLRSLAIPTGEDPDKISSEELTDRFKAEKEVENQMAAAENEPISASQIKALEKLAKRKGSEIGNICMHYHIESLANMTKKQYGDCLNTLNERADVDA